MECWSEKKGKYYDDIVTGCTWNQHKVMCMYLSHEEKLASVMIINKSL